MKITRVLLVILAVVAFVSAGTPNAYAAAGGCEPALFMSDGTYCTSCFLTGAWEGMFTQEIHCDYSCETNYCIWT